MPYCVQDTAFSTGDTRQNWWQKRKSIWHQKKHFSVSFESISSSASLRLCSLEFSPMSASLLALPPLSGRDLIHSHSFITTLFPVTFKSSLQPQFFLQDAHSYFQLPTGNLHLHGMLYSMLYKEFSEVMEMLSTCTSQYGSHKPHVAIKCIIKFKIPKFLSFTSHISSGQYPHVASGYYIGQHSFRQLKQSQTELFFLPQLSLFLYFLP